MTGIGDTAAEIRAWLDEHGPGLRPGPMEAALLAVLDLCDDGPGTPLYEMAQVSKILATIAEALGSS